MSHRRLLASVLTILVLSLVACSTKSDAEPIPAGEQTPAPGSTTLPAETNSPLDPEPDHPTSVASTETAGGDPTPKFSPISLPKRQITFRVAVPANTPENDPVFLTIMDITGGESERIRMKNLGNGIFETQAEVLDDALVRYTYDRFEYVDVCCLAELTRESLGESFNLQYRLLLTESNIDRVADTIPIWADLREPFTEGEITGTVVDATTGEPVFDADVSISGVHVGTRVDGSFRVPRLPAGEHKVVIHSDTGDFLPVQKIVTLSPGDSASANFEVSSTTLVPVSFDVLLPDSTPDDAWVKIAGNIHALGGRIGHPSRPMTPDNFFIPPLEREGNTASAEFMLPEGAHVEYFYTIGPIGVTQERTTQGRTVYRSFKVAKGSDQRFDKVEFWNNEGWPLVTLSLVPPVNTPDDAKISLNMGPSSWLERRDDGTYSTVLGTGPVGTEMSYRYILGDSFDGLDASPEADGEGVRTFTVPENGGTITEVVTRWIGQSDPSARQEGGSLSVKFRVSVPPETPVDAEIFISGNRPAMGSGVRMTPHPGNPWLYEADVVFGHDGPLSYKYELRSEASESSAHSITTDYDGQVVNDWVASWPGMSKSVKSREGFVKGIYTPDFFSNNFIGLSESTFERIVEHEGSAVVVSSIWSYGQSQPIPTLEYRGVHAGSVATPLEEAIEQSRIAREAGLEVFFGPQFNMEQAPGGFEVYSHPKSDEWWTEWLKLADEMWTWQATVAEIIDAEYMMVPGPLFHVYEYIDKLPDDPFILEFEAEQTRLMEKIRGIYSGKLIVSGGNKNYDFPGLADYNGVTTYDTGIPELPADTTVAEYIDYYEDRFVERVDTIYEKWGNPVFFYTVHAPAVPTDEDPSGELAQANAMEAIFQVMADRPFINGSLSWAYEMIDAPLVPSDGVRGRLAEAVLAKWYAILGGEN